MRNTYITGYYAMYLNGLGNQSFEQPCYLSSRPFKKGNVLELNIAVFVFNPKYDKENDIFYNEKHKAWLPSAERSIIDEMTVRTVQDEFFYFGIEDYLDFYGTKEILLSKAEEYGVKDEMKRELENMKAFIEEHYNY